MSLVWSYRSPKEKKSHNAVRDERDFIVLSITYKYIEQSATYKMSSLFCNYKAIILQQNELLKTYDFAIAWNWEYDREFIQLIQKFFVWITCQF